MNATNDFSRRRPRIPSREWTDHSWPAPVGSRDAARECATAADVRVAAPDTIRGIVFDSLMHQPIPDATVQADSGGVSTLTDREGRFTLIAPDNDPSGDGVSRPPGSHRPGQSPGGSDADDVALDAGALHAVARDDLGARLPGAGHGKGTTTGSSSAPRAEADGSTRFAGAQVRVSWDFNTPGGGRTARPAVPTPGRTRRAPTTPAERLPTTTCTSSDIPPPSVRGP